MSGAVMVSESRSGGVYYAVRAASGLIVWERFVKVGHAARIRAGGAAFREAAREQEQALRAQLAEEARS